MISDPGFLGYAAAALLFFGLTLLLVTSWRGRLQGVLLVAATTATTVWAAIAAAQAAFHVVPVWVVWSLEALRNLAWLLFLVRLLRSLIRGSSGYTGFAGVISVMAYSLCGLLLVPFEHLGPAQDFFAFVGLDVDLRLLAQVILAVCGLVLVEQFYRNTSLEQRWGIKYLCLGLGGLFAFDFFLFSDALLFKRLDSGIWSARGAINAMIAPLIAVSAARNPEWSLNVFVSRRAIFHTTALLSAGIYMLLMAVVGYYIRIYGGEWGRALQIVFLFGAGLVLVMLLFSGQMRARIKVFFNKHFFSYKYDYRDEWLRLIGVLSGRETTNIHLFERVIYAICEIVDSPGGCLWLCNEENKCTNQASWNMPQRGEVLFHDSGTLQEYFGRTRWVVNLEEYAVDPDIYDGLILPDAIVESKTFWLIVPLLHDEKLFGFVMLAKPRAPQTLNWENTDLLKTAGMQAASYLAFHQAAQALAETRQFEGFDRLSAFIVHDLKNLIAQLSLVAKNAERHRHNPEFIDDAIQTINNSVGKMNRLLGQLKSAGSGGRADKIEMHDVVNSVLLERSLQKPRPETKIETSELIYVWADKDRLVSVLGHVVQNAQEATPSDGWVQIRLRAPQDQVILEVEDTGSGMDDRFIRERLFKPFDSTKGLTGMGVGAYECREFVRSLGGHVDVRSSPGKGTNFIIRIPRADSEVTDIERTLETG